jgi:hypothetical protein
VHSNPSGVRRNTPVVVKVRREMAEGRHLETERDQGKIWNEDVPYVWRRKKLNTSY